MTQPHAPQVSALDHITREVQRRIVEADGVRRQIEAGVAEAQARVQSEGDRLVRDLAGRVEDRVVEIATQQVADTIGDLIALPTLPEFPGVLEVAGPTPEADARSRAGRTAVQGLVATLVLTTGTAILEAVTAPGFGLADVSAWRTAVVGAVITGCMAALSWLQRRTGH